MCEDVSVCEGGEGCTGKVSSAVAVLGWKLPSVTSRILRSNSLASSTPSPIVLGALHHHYIIITSYIQHVHVHVLYIHVHRNNIMSQLFAKFITIS